MKLVPDPSFLPVAESTPAGHAGATAHLDRQILPRNAGLKDEDDPGQTGPIRDAGTAALGLGWVRWEERGDDRPEIVAHQGLAHPLGLPHHQQVLKGTLNLDSSASTCPHCPMPTLPGLTNGGNPAPDLLERPPTVSAGRSNSRNFAPKQMFWSSP